jgi:hypothetical protein
MPEFLPESARKTGSVDRQPFVRADRGMEFGRLPAPPRYRVRLTVPPTAVGQRLRIWADRPYTVVVEQVLTGAEWVGELEGAFTSPSCRACGTASRSAAPETLTWRSSGPAPPVPDRPGAGRFRLSVRIDNPPPPSS